MTKRIVIALWLLGCQGVVRDVPAEPVDGRERPDGTPVYGETTCRPPVERLWALTPAQLAATYAQLAPGLDRIAMQAALARYVAVGDPYRSDPAVLNGSPLVVGEHWAAARTLGDAIDVTAIDPCAASAIDDVCASRLIDRLVAPLFRRPLNDEERSDYAAYVVSQNEMQGPEAAVRALVRRAAVAPATLFRSEIGVLDRSTGAARLTPNELADLIAFTLTDGPPDAELLAAATDGSITDPAVIRAHAERLLRDPPAENTVADVPNEAPRRIAGILRFFYEWLDIDRTRLAAHEDERLLRWLDNEAMLFTRHVLWLDDGRLETLLAADYTVYSSTLAAHYGLGTDPEGTPVLPTRDGRRGLLMQAGFLTGHVGPTHRGRWIRERLFCAPIRAPANVDMNLAGLEQELEDAEDRNLSPREVRARHLGEGSCAGCHRLMDPLGFPFDAFDALGRPRTMHDGFPVDTAGEIAGTDATDGPVADASQLVLRLSTSPDVADCFVAQLYAYVHGRAPAEEDGCYLERLTARFRASGGDVRDLLIEMLVGDEMRLRTPRWAEGS